MTTTWQTHSLEEIAYIQGGGTPSRKVAEYFDGDIPWVTPTDLPPIGIVGTLRGTKECISRSGLTNSSVKLIDAGSVLFSSRASIGKIVVTECPCTTNQGFANFTPRKEMVDPWFLAYLLRRYTPEITSLAGKTTFLEVPRGRLKLFKARFPDLAEQRRIVARIKECMERVDEIETLRAESRKDAEHLPSAVFADYVESLGQDQINGASIGDVVIECKYGTSRKANANNNGVPVLRMGNIQNGRLDVEDLKHIDLPPREKAKCLLAEGDILINRTNSLELVGKSAVFTGLTGEWVYASYLVRIRIDTRRVLPQYVNAVINSRIGRGYVYRTARRAIGMVNINAKEIQKMPLPLPPLGEQEALIMKMNEAAPLINELGAVFRYDGISHLRESILRKAFAGEL